MKFNLMKLVGKASTTLLASLAIATAAVVSVLAAESHPDASSTPKDPVPMKKYVMMFLPNPNVLSEADIKKRDAEIHAWAVQNNAVRHLEPRIPAASGTSIRMNSGNESIAKDTNAPVVALLFFEAADMTDAVKFTQTHPGLRYGANLVVCEWTQPGANRK